MEKRIAGLDYEGFQTYFVICGIRDVLAGHAAAPRINLHQGSLKSAKVYFESQTRTIEVVDDAGCLKRLRFRTPKLWLKLDQESLRPKITNLVFETCTIDEQEDKVLARTHKHRQKQTRTSEHAHKHTHVYSHI